MLHQMQPIRKINVLWITAGLGCDGESVALTGATQPSIEEIVMGGLPGIPEVRFLNPFYSYENADEYLHYLELAAEGELDPFLLVIEGSIPNEQVIAGEGSWRLWAQTNYRATDSTCDWIDRLRQGLAVMAVAPARRMAAYTRWKETDWQWDCRIIRLGMEIKG